jgi:ABC-type multidrug transport system permease subunit
MKYSKLIPKSAFKFYGYLKKDSMLLYKRKNYLAVFILLPLIIAGLFLFALQPSGYSIDVGVCNNDLGDLSSEALNLDNFDPIFLDEENCLENLLEGIRVGDFPLGIVIHSGFSENIENLKQSKIDVYYDNTDVSFANLIRWKLDSSLKPLKVQIIDELNSELGGKTKVTRGGLEIITERLNLDFVNEELDDLDNSLRNVEELDTNFLIDPVYVNHNPIYPDEAGKGAGIIFIMPILVLFIVLMLASTSIIYDKKSNFIMRVKSSTTILNYLLAKLLFFVALVLIQFGIIILLFILFGSRYAFNFLGLAELVLSIAIVDSLLGFLIGLVSENEGIAVLFSLIISFPLMLVSGIFFPTQTLPKVIQWFAGIMPLEFQIRASRAVLLFGEGMGHGWLWLAGGLLILVLLAFRKKV